MTVPLCRPLPQFVVTMLSFKIRSATRAASLLRAATSPARLATCSTSTATGITDGLGHLGAIFGPVVVVGLGDMTSGHGFYGFMLYCAIAGALVPALLLWFLGMSQRGAVLEEVAT